MDNKERFIQIEEVTVSEGLKANLVIIEDNGEGQAYLGWCENLAIDPNATSSNEEEPSMLVLPFADLALLTRQGTPILAPSDWQNLVIRPLVIQDYLLVTIEEESVSELNTATVS